MPVFLDTNILLYAISDDPAEAGKRVRARDLLARPDCVVSVQVLQEFYAQATRPGRRTAPLPHALASDCVRAWARLAVVENSSALLLAALDLKSAVNFSIWDCLILAAARAASCNTLYTEDMQEGRTIEGVRLVDPFR